MKRRSLGWFRYRMISGVILSTLGIIIGAKLVLGPGAPQNKITGFGLAIVFIALGVVRTVQYLGARTAPGARPRNGSR